MGTVLVTLRRRLNDRLEDLETDFELPVDVPLAEIIKHLSMHEWVGQVAWRNGLNSGYLVQKLDHSRNPVLDIAKTILENEEAPGLSILDGDALVISIGRKRFDTPIKIAPNVVQPTLQCIWTGQTFELGDSDRPFRIGCSRDAEVQTDLLLEGSFTDLRQARIERIIGPSAGLWCIFDGWSSGEPSKNGTYLRAPQSGGAFAMDTEGQKVLSDQPSPLQHGDLICLGERVKRGPVLRLVLPS